MDWDDVRYFLAVQRRGSLSEAGRRLRVDATTVGRRIAALEEALGARLFVRTSGGWRLSEAGQRVLPSAERLEAEVTALGRAARGAAAAVEGVVRLTTIETVATRFIAPALPALRTRHPGLDLELLCTMRTLDLARGEADVALRIARPKEEALVARKLTEIHFGAYASRGYLEARGLAPDTLRSLDGVDALDYAEALYPTAESAWLHEKSETPRVALRTTSVSTLLAATIAGLGVALLPVAVAEGEPALVRLPALGAPRPRPIWQVVHRDVAETARVRAVLDFLGELFARPGLRP